MLKNDPKLVAAARELRDRYIEQINSGRMLPAAQGKYDVSRQLADESTRGSTQSNVVLGLLERL